MGILKPLNDGHGWAKVGLLGFPKSGKTFTAAEIAIGIHRFFGHTTPIAFFDTEGGSSYVADKIKEATGHDLVGVRSRSLSDLLETTKDIEEAGINILIVDSITHPWRENCDSYLDQLNKQLAKKGKSRRYSLEFQDWGPVKARWQPWTDWYLNSNVHVIICGRAGFEYDKIVNEDTGKKELTKTGTKMKTESEFGFEPSLLIEMERDGNQRIATVIGDRFDEIDGKVFTNPTFETFLPHIGRLKRGGTAAVDTTLKTDHDIDLDGDGAWFRERRERQILCEEIQGEIVKHYPGQTTADKTAKADLFEKFFATRSWTKIENMDSALLSDALRAIRHYFREVTQ